jgi:hypothetical protein
MFGYPVFDYLPVDADVGIMVIQKIRKDLGCRIIIDGDIEIKLARGLLAILFSQQDLRAFSMAMDLSDLIALRTAFAIPLMT